MKIAFLGLGAMGSRMAARLVAAGHEVVVWNRSARALPGAAVAGTPREAAVGAEMVIATVRDDAASEAVWLGPEGALAGMGPGALGIECSTVTPDHVRRLHGLGRFVDAPMAGSRPQAEAGQLIFLVGGDLANVARAEPVLLAMGATVHHAGACGAGAAVKLMVNTLFATQVAVMAELIGMADRAGIDPARAVEIIGATPVASPAGKGAAAAMLGRGFAPAFPIDLVVKDLAMALASGADLPMAAVTAAVFGRAVDAGHASANITGVVQLFRR